MMRYLIVLHTLRKGQKTVPLAKSLESVLSTYVKPNFPEYSNLTQQSTVCLYTARTVKNPFTSEHKSH